MFFYNEYNNHLISIHLNEKLKFYRFKYFLSLKSIILLIKYIRIKFKVFNDIYDKKLFICTKLLFYSYLNIPIKYLNMSENDHSCYSIVVLNNLLYKYNIFYFFFLSYSYEYFKNTFLVDTSKKKKKIKKHMYKIIKLNFYTLNNSPSHEMFYELSSLNTFINITFKSNTNNYFFNKLLYSHTLLNI